MLIWNHRTGGTGFAKCFSNDAELKEPEELDVKKIFRKIMLLS